MDYKYPNTDDIKEETKRLLNIHFTKNIIFYITIISCLYIISNKSIGSFKFVKCIFTWLCISFAGYTIHVISHNFNIRFLLNGNNIFLQNKTINNFITKIIDTYEFHDKIHHDINVNKKIHNIFYEFFLNILTQGLGLILLIEFLKILDYRVIFLWAFFYTSVHNINYNIMHPTTHKNHHTNCKTNYGIDLMDILFNTKYDKNDIENFNHASINILLFTFIIYFL